MEDWLEKEGVRQGCMRERGSSEGGGRGNDSIIRDVEVREGGGACGKECICGVSE